MKYKEKRIEDYVKDNISIFVDENIYSWRFYDSIELKYVYTNDKETNYINNFGVTMCLDNEEIGYFILKSMTLFNDVLNFKSYDRYVELLEFGLEVNDEKYAKSLLNYLLYIARIEGNKFVKISNRYKEFNYFYELLVKEAQSIVIKLSGLMFIVGFILAGLDFRFKWFALPPLVSYIASGTLLLGYIMWGVVLKQNTYVARTIKVEENQKVVDTGLYGVVRHPMYTASIILFLSIPLVLGSLIALGVFIFYPILIIARILNEEKVLENELQGYKEYKKKVKYRLIPFIW